jgi:integrase
LILTAARTSEVLEMPHTEIKESVWIVNASRMKAGREHRVPLCARSLEIIAEMKKLYTGPYVFPGLKLSRPLSKMALLVLLERMGRSAYRRGDLFLKRLALMNNWGAHCGHVVHDGYRQLKS